MTRFNAPASTDASAGTKASTGSGDASLVGRARPVTGRFRGISEHLGVLVVYALIAVGASWPLARNFRSWALADATADHHHSMWMLWHVKEAVLGRQPWFTADLLFYPYGLSTLVDGVGPISGILSLPFWFWGPVAAYNGTLLLALTLSGWCMYLLVRYGHSSTGVVPTFSIDPVRASDHGHAIATDGTEAATEAMHRLVALFAGAVFMLWPIQLAGLWGHLEKLFVGSLPLAVLAGLLASDPARSRWFLLAPGGALLLALLQNGNQFLFAVMALALLGICTIVVAPRAMRLDVIARLVVSGALSLVIAGPLVVKVARVAFDPSIQVSVNLAAPVYAPDVLQFFLPSIHQRALGPFVYPDFLTLSPGYSRVSFLHALNRAPGWVGSSIETSVTVPYVVLLLAIVAALTRVAAARVWVLFSGLFVLLSLGPVLRFAGRTTFTDYRQMQLLPYAYLVSLPGFDTMRTPGRLMMIAGVGLTLLAAAGLAALMRHGRRPALAAAVAIALALVELWPVPWPQQVPPPSTPFHQRLASDRERYAVLDLPSGATEYMYYQTLHGKGIAWGYLSRTPHVHPVASLRDVEATELAPGAAKRMRADLGGLGYRYVIWHKHWEVFGHRRPEAAKTRRLGTPTGWMASTFLREAFVGEPPVWDDELVTVFRMGSPEGPANLGAPATQ